LPLCQVVAELYTARFVAAVNAAEKWAFSGLANVRLTCYAKYFEPRSTHCQHGEGKELGTRKIENSTVEIYSAGRWIQQIVVGSPRGNPTKVALKKKGKDFATRLFPPKNKGGDDISRE